VEGDRARAPASAATRSLKLEVFDSEHRDAVEYYATRSPGTAFAYWSELRATLTGMHGPRASTSEVGQALHDMAAAGVERFSPNALRGFLRGARNTKTSGGEDIDQLIQRVKREEGDDGQ